MKSVFMSYFTCPDAETSTNPCPEAIDLVILPRTSDLGGFEVQRALPSAQRRLVGPFIFWDQMGPGEFLTGQGIDVRPHPHIGLATLTYLFDGSIMHRDSLGSQQLITPGDVNLMTAGCGIVHSERTATETRQHPHRLFGIQCWLALPGSKQEIDPAFIHHSEAELPFLEADGAQIRLVAGNMEGAQSPVQTVSDTLFADVTLAANGRVRVPTAVEERAIYVTEGDIDVQGTRYPAGQMLVLKPGAEVIVRALTPSRLMLLGGEAMDGQRYIWWNFVSNSKERLEQAKADWKNNKFAPVPGETEFIPLPE